MVYRHGLFLPAFLPLSAYASKDAFSIFAYTPPSCHFYAFMPHPAPLYCLLLPEEGPVRFHPALAVRIHLPIIHHAVLG